MGKPSEPRGEIKTTKTVFRIIEFIRAGDGARVKELSDELDLSRSTIHNHLSTLEHLGLIFKKDHTSHISLRFLDLGIYARDRLDIYNVGASRVDELAEETGGMARLFVEQGNRGIIIHESSGKHAVKTIGRIGRHEPLHAIAAGKVMLSEMSLERIQDIVDEQGLPKVTENTITDRDELVEELKQISDQGYAFNDNETIDGLRAVASPITVKNTVHGAIAVAGPTNWMRGERFRDEIPAAVLEAANEIELKLKYPSKRPET